MKNVNCCPRGRNWLFNPFGFSRLASTMQDLFRPGFTVNWSHFLAQHFISNKTYTPSHSDSLSPLSKLFFFLHSVGWLPLPWPDSPWVSSPFKLLSCLWESTLPTSKLFFSPVSSAMASKNKETPHVLETFRKTENLFFYDAKTREVWHRKANYSVNRWMKKADCVFHGVLHASSRTELSVSAHKLLFWALKQSWQRAGWAKRWQEWSKNLKTTSYLKSLPFKYPRYPVSCLCFQATLLCPITMVFLP